MDNSEVSGSGINVNSLGGFIIDSGAYSSLSREFRDLKQTYGLKRDTPVKWSPGSDDQRFRLYRSLPNLNQFRRDVLTLLASKDIQVICCFINNEMDQIRQMKRLRRISKTDYKRIQISYNQRALEYVAQRFQRELQGTRERGQIVIEFNSDSEMNSSLGAHYRDFHTNGSGRPHFNIRFPNLEDGLHFSHDFCCDGIEFADFITSSLTTALRSAHYGYVEIFKAKIRNARGQSKGFGIVVYPSASIIADNLIRKIDSR
ncbi:MAG: hypothetical protein ACK4MV_04390 [Beijerinckiaceae bacterium]